MGIPLEPQESRVPSRFSQIEIPIDLCEYIHVIYLLQTLSQWIWIVVLLLCTLCVAGWANHDVGSLSHNRVLGLNIFPLGSWSPMLLLFLIAKVGNFVLGKLYITFPYTLHILVTFRFLSVCTSFNVVYSATFVLKCIHTAFCNHDDCVRKHKPSNPHVGIEFHLLSLTGYSTIFSRARATIWKEQRYVFYFLILLCLGHWSTAIVGKYSHILYSCPTINARFRSRCCQEWFGLGRPSTYLHICV